MFRCRPGTLQPDICALTQSATPRCRPSRLPRSAPVPVPGLSLFAHICIDRELAMSDSVQIVFPPSPALHIQCVAESMCDSFALDRQHWRTLLVPARLWYLYSVMRYFICAGVRRFHPRGVCFVLPLLRSGLQSSDGLDAEGFSETLQEWARGGFPPGDLVLDLGQCSSRGRNCHSDFPFSFQRRSGQCCLTFTRCLVASMCVASVYLFSGPSLDSLCSDRASG